VHTGDYIRVLLEPKYFGFLEPWLNMAADENVLRQIFGILICLKDEKWFETGGV